MPRATAPPSERAAAPDAAAAGLASSLRLTIARLARRVRQEGVTARDDVTASRLAALTTIGALGPITLGDLAAVEQVQPPSMTRIVARLEEAGLTEREVDPQDRRSVRVRITDKGKRLLARSRTRRDAFLAQRIARLTAEERDVLARALPLLDQLMEDD
jgi:DNA-binding MarR family transcriptional regulator